MAWAFATLGERDEPLLQAIAEDSIKERHEFNSQNLSNTSWAFATIGVTNEPLLKALAAEAIAKISEFNP